MKCEFFLRRVNVLGKTIEDGQIFPGEEKIQGLKDLRIPRNLAELRSVYGLLSYFRMFVPNFTKRAKPITNLLKVGNGEVDWGPE